MTPASDAAAAGPSLRLAVGGDRLATLTFDAPGRKVNVFSRAGAFGRIRRLTPSIPVASTTPARMITPTVA